MFVTQFSSTFLLIFLGNLFIITPFRWSSADKVNVAPCEVISLAELADEKYYPARDGNYMIKFYNNVTLVNINLAVSEGQKIETWEKLVTLPEGYRVINAIAVPCTMWGKQGQFAGFGALKQEFTGEIWLCAPSVPEYTYSIRGQMIYGD